MMRPLFTDIITVYARTVENRAEIWRRSVLAGVQWRQKSVSSSDAQGKVVYQTETSVTMPYPVFCAAPGRGDVIVPGECAQEIGGSYTVDRLIKEHGGVTVQAVSDNTQRPRLRHWKVRAV